VYWLRGMQPGDEKARGEQADGQTSW